MPVRYDQDTKAKAIRLVRDHASDYPSEYAAITAVARRLGMTPETLRKWIRQAAVDEGRASGVTTRSGPAATPSRSPTTVSGYHRGRLRTAARWPGGRCDARHEHLGVVSADAGPHPAQAPLLAPGAPGSWPTRSTSFRPPKSEDEKGSVDVIAD